MHRSSVYQKCVINYFLEPNTKHFVGRAAQSATVPPQPPHNLSETASGIYPFVLDLKYLDGEELDRTGLD